MILEADRLIADWLADATYGVNALLASTPRDAGDAQPANVTIYDETRDSTAARGDVPTSLPAVIVTTDRVDQLDGQVATTTRDGQVTVRVRYVISQAATATAIQDSSYVLRTVLRSLRKFFDLNAAAAGRTRNSIYLESCLSLAGAPMWTPMEDAVVTGGIIATIQLRDLTP
jgi:hypothetical protein